MGSIILAIRLALIGAHLAVLLDILSLSKSSYLCCASGVVGHDAMVVRGERRLLGGRARQHRVHHYTQLWCSRNRRRLAGR